MGAPDCRRACCMTKVAIRPVRISKDQVHTMNLKKGANTETSLLKAVKLKN